MNSEIEKKLKILAADDHWIARAALVNLLKSMDQETEILEASDYQETLDQARDNPGLDLILIDLVMPGMNGPRGLELLRSEAPGTPVMVVSVSEDRNDLLQCVSLGAVGYVPKTASGDEIIKAIELVLAGEVSLPRRILEQPPGVRSPIGGSYDTPGLKAISEERLTQRQRQIFALLSEGMSNAEIAKRLDLSINTVRVHIHGILQRLQLENRMQVVLHAATQRQAQFGNVGQGNFG